MNHLAPNRPCTHRHWEASYLSVWPIHRPFAEDMDRSSTRSMSASACYRELTVKRRPLRRIRSRVEVN